jgi:hypothetical protein
MMRRGRRSTPHSTEHELLDACARPHCLVCDLSRAASRRYLAGVLGSGINDPQLRSDWRRRGGLCGRHWGVLRTLDAPALPAAILAQDLLRSYLEGGRPAADCPACEEEAGAEARYLAALDRLAPARLEPVLAEGRGFLCLSHLARLRGAPLRRTFEQRLSGLLEELETFQHKQDYRFRDEPAGAERDSWLRAIRALKGDV